MTHRSAWMAGLLGCIGVAAFVLMTRESASPAVRSDAGRREQSNVDGTRSQPPTTLGTSPTRPHASTPRPPDEQQGVGNSSPSSGPTGPSSSASSAAGAGLAQDASPEVVSLLAGWAESASDFTVTVEPRAKGLPRRVRRKSDGGLMVLIPSGQFTMGRGLAPAKFDAGPDSAPDVQVQISKAFFMDETEVTNAQWARFVASTEGVGVDSRSSELDGSFPVVGVAFDEARRFATWVGCSLPTEAQWEWTARAGREQQAIWPYDIEPDSLAGVTGSNGPPRYWTGSIADGPTRVGRYAPIHWGVFDMAGNASELCRDAYTADFYTRSLGIPRIDPVSESDDASTPRVVRGGSWFEDRRDLRVFARSSTARSDVRGISFRCVREVVWDLRAGVPASEERPRATEDPRPR